MCGWFRFYMSMLCMLNSDPSVSSVGQFVVSNVWSPIFAKLAVQQQELDKWWWYTCGEKLLRKKLAATPGSNTLLQSCFVAANSDPSEQKEKVSGLCTSNPRDCLETLIDSVWRYRFCSASTSFPPIPVYTHALHENLKVGKTDIFKTLNQSQEEKANQGSNCL